METFRCQADGEGLTDDFLFGPKNEGEFFSIFFPTFFFMSPCEANPTQYDLGCAPSQYYLVVEG